MAELFLKNSTGALIEIIDLGLVIDDGQSVPIDENDFDGYLTSDMIAALADIPANGLILSTTDIGNTAGDLPAIIAQERITLKSHWKPMRADFASLPLTGNEPEDVRLVEAEGVLYTWDQSGAQWSPITSTFSLTVSDIDEENVGTNISNLTFVQTEDGVYIDQTNNTAYIGPPNPPLTLDSRSLVVTNTTLYSGGLSQSNINYKNAAGEVVNYVINDAIFTVSIPTDVDSCNFGDEGVISFVLNGNPIASADLGVNFQELNRDTTQDMNNYDIQGSGDSMTNGRVDFTGTAAGKGYMQIESVSKYNNFKYYQKWQAKVEITDATLLRQGYNALEIKHTGITPVQGSNVLDIFYDIDAGANPSVSVPTVTEDTPLYKYLSGVHFYGAGSTWDVDVSGIDLFDNAYHSSESPIVLSGWPGMTTTAIRYDDATVGGVADPPDIGNSMSISNWNLEQQSGAMGTGSQLTVTPRDSYGTYTPVISAANNTMIFSYGTESTNIMEYFRDEEYRLLDNAYDTIPGSFTGIWDSTQSLDTYDDGNGLQVYMDELYFPTEDFTDDLPVGPDYTVIAAETNKTYYRAFYHNGISHSSGKLKIEGITKTQLYDRNIRVWIKAPSQTGWLDLTRDYNYPDFNGDDDDACWVNRAGQTNDEFEFSLGMFGTQSSGWMIIVKIEYPNALAPRIQTLGVTNWV